MTCATDYDCQRLSETAHHTRKTPVVRELHKFGLGPQMGLETETDLLAVHNMTLTMKAVFLVEGK
jgi:hypothetical protein